MMTYFSRGLDWILQSYALSAEDLTPLCRCESRPRALPVTVVKAAFVRSAHLTFCEPVRNDPKEPEIWMH